MLISGESWVLYENIPGKESFRVSQETPIADGQGGWHDFPAMIIIQDKTGAEDLAAWFNAQPGIPKRVQLIDCDGTMADIEGQDDAGQNSNS